MRELALFDLGIDGKLRGRDLVALKVRDVCHGDQATSRAVVMQHKTQRPVQFEITPTTRDALQAWIKLAELTHEDFLFPCRLDDSPHQGTRPHARILGNRVDELGLDRADYGTHSMRRTKARLIHRRTKNLRAVQPILGYSKLGSTVTHHSLEVDDAVPFHSDLWAAARAARLCCADRRTPWLSLNHRGVRPSVVFRPTPSVHIRSRSLRLPLVSC